MAESQLSRAIHIKKLAPNITKEKISDSLSISGPIESIELGNQEAIVIFENAEGAENSLMLDKTYISGCEIAIEMATSLKLPKIVEQVISPPIENIKEENTLRKKELNKLSEKKDEDKKNKDSNLKAQLKVSLDYCNVPARVEFPRDDPFAAVFNRKYGVMIITLWSFYLIFMSLFGQN